MEEQIYKYHGLAYIETYYEFRNYTAEIEDSDLHNFYSTESENYCNVLNELFDGKTITSIKWDYTGSNAIKIIVTATRELTEKELVELNDVVTSLNHSEINANIQCEEFMPEDTGLSECFMNFQLV